MGIDLLGIRLVEGNKAPKNIAASGIDIAFGTIIVGEVVSEWRVGQFVGKQVHLVKEQNDGCLDEPPGVADGIKQGESLLHSVDCLVLNQNLVIFADGHEEKNGSDVLETMDPLFTL